jgi:uncharacterized membrane protein YdbT with pleckstrin-like domain
MGYIEDNLMSDEELIHVTRLHPIVLLAPAMTTSFLAGLISIVRDIPWAFFVVAILLVLSAYRLVGRLVFFLTSEFGISSKRVLGKTGFIKRRSLDIVLVKVEAIRLDQNILGRLFNYGSVEVTGTGGTEEVLRFIPEPLAFRNTIQEQLWRLNKDKTDAERLMEM